MHMFDVRDICAGGRWNLKTRDVVLSFDRETQDPMDLLEETVLLESRLEPQTCSQNTKSQPYYTSSSDLTDYLSASCRVIAVTPVLLDHLVLQVHLVLRVQSVKPANRETEESL